MAEPTPIDLVHQLREALGWPVVAMPCSPEEAWAQAVRQVRILRELCDFWVPLPTALDDGSQHGD